MTTAVVVMARMGSTRLPGKVLKEVLGRPLLAFLLERLKRAKRPERLVVATSMRDVDTPIVELAAREHVATFRGSEHDTVERLYLAARERSADPVIRVTADCPMIDPDTVDEVAEKIAGGAYDYVVTDGIPPRYPNGMGCEAFRASALERFYRGTRECDPEAAWESIRDPAFGFRVGVLPGPSPSLGHHRWTVDTAEDLDLVSRVIETLYPAKPAFGLHDIAALLNAHPEWVAINAEVRQRTGPHAFGAS